MEFDGQSVEFIWLPSEDELPEITSILQSKSWKTVSQKGPLKTLEIFLCKLFDCSVQICDLKQKIIFGTAAEDYSVKRSTPISMFYSEYLFKVNCVIESGRSSHPDSVDTDQIKKLIKRFCYERCNVNYPELWINLDTSSFIENDLRTNDKCINLKSFSLGNIVKLNKFVEHFGSETSLESYNYKITQVVVNFLHDAQVLHVRFVVASSKVSFKKRSPKTHRMHKLIIPYSSIHTVLLNRGENISVYFRMYKTPLLFAVEQDEEAESYISCMDLTSNSKWVRTAKLFDTCPPCISKEFNMNSVLKLDFCCENYEVLKIMLYHKSVQLYFSPMSVVSYKHVHDPFQFKDFDCYYGAYCLLTHSYETLDHLMMKEEMNKIKTFITEKCDENPKALSDSFYIIHSAISQCNVIMLSYSLKVLYERLSSRGPIYNFGTMESNLTHNMLLIKRAIITPTHIRFVPPQLILKSRALRDCDPKFLLRISIRDVNLETINYSFKAFSPEGKKHLKEFFDNYFRETILKGIKVGQRHYYYVGSSTSQLRSHGLWFYAQDDSGETADVLRTKFGEMEKIKQVPKFMARMGQTFSQAMTNITVPQKDTNINNPEEDIMGGVKKFLDVEYLDENKKFLKVVTTVDRVTDEEPYCFSDGIGRISLEIANEVYEALGMEETRPCAMQIRYAGCKGMLVVDPNLKGRNIVFRKSMKKFNSDSTSLEILKLSEKRSASLNRPLITILEQLGVPKEVFIKLQKDMIQNHIRSMFHETDACDFLSRNSQLRLDFIGMHNVGIRFTEDPLFRSMIYGLFRKHLDLLKNKASIEIPIDKARAVFGVIDESFTLEYGQVFFQYSDWHSDEHKIITGTVVVTKNPCMHPGDVRKFEAVDVKTLHHIRDCIVFPAKGDRPHPDEMAGSDLDGDEYHVMWLEDLIFSRANVKAMDFAMPKGRCKEVSSEVQREDEMDHLCDYIVNDNVGLIASAHLVLADKETKGIFSEKCIRLAKKYAISLDFAKSGIPAVRDKKDIPFKYPDFMMKVEEKTTNSTYVSKKALGVLFRNCKCLEMGLETANNEVEYRVDEDFIFENWENYKKSATEMYKKYCQEVEYLINVYSFENEGELLAGAIINPPKYYEQRHDLENLKALLEYEVQWIFRDLKRQFFNEFGGKPVDGKYTEKMFQKASAWYAVTYVPEGTVKKNCYFGFPWAAGDVLKKLKENRYLHKGYKSFNQKSILAELVDRSLGHHIPEMSEDSEISVIYENRLKILDVARHVLLRWLETQRDIVMIPNFKAFDKVVEREFQSVSNILLSCNVQYIKNLKKKNRIHQAISPFHYILETMLCIASMKTSKIKHTFVDYQQELGLLSWVTLIKLACSYNPQYLGIADKHGNYASRIFYVPQDNIVSIFKVCVFDKSPNKESCSNEEFSLQLLLNSEKVTKYLTEQTKLKDIEFRFDIEGDKEYIAIFTVMGSRYAIEKLKDFIVMDEFFRWVVRDEQLYSSV